jgi:hypothetical protein
MCLLFFLYNIMHLYANIIFIDSYKPRLFRFRLSSFLWEKQPENRSRWAFCPPLSTLHTRNIHETPSNPKTATKKALRHILCVHWTYLEVFSGVVKRRDLHNVFTSNVVHPAFLGKLIWVHFYFAGFVWLPKGEVINTHFAFCVFRMMKKKEPCRRLRTHTTFAPSPRNKKRLRHSVERESRKPWSSYYMLRVNKLFRKICLARFVAVCFSLS